jgi:hypothetical protein
MTANKLIIDLANLTIGFVGVLILDFLLRIS